MKTPLFRAVAPLAAGLLFFGSAAPVAGMAPRPSRSALTFIEFPGNPANVSPTGAGGWVSRAPMPQAVYSAQACEVDGVVYVIGGDTATRVVGDVMAYHIRDDTWSGRSRMSLQRSFFAACAVDGLIYVIGGEDPRSDTRTVYVEAYDPATDSWTPKAPMHGARSCLASVAVDGIIYAIGGCNGEFPDEARPLADVEAFDPVAGRWTYKAPLPKPIVYPYACAVDGTIYVFGADGGDVFAFDPVENQWSTKATGLRVGKNPEAVEVLDGLVYLFEPGGVVVYDPRQSAFTLKQSMPTVRHDATSAAFDGRIYLFGGTNALVDHAGNSNITVLAANEMFVPIAPLPVIERQPVAQNVIAGEALTLSVNAGGESDAVTYQWRRNGVDIPGATGASLTLPCAQHCHAGQYSVVVTSAFGSTTSEIVPVDVELPLTNGARLLNLSSRALCLTGENALIPGFVIAGSGTKQVLLRAVGPKLAEFGVSGALADPTLRLRCLNGATWMDVAANDDWFTQLDGRNSDLVAGATQRVGAFTLDLASKDAALLVDLAPGVYSVAGAGKDGCTGVELVELYDADRTDTDPGTARFANLSTRGFVGTGAEVMIPGFVVSSEGPKTFLVRAVGPCLQAFGVGGVLADPKLSLLRRLNGDTSVDQLVLESDNWSDIDAAFTAAVAEQVGAFALATGSKDAAMVVTLPPGVYSAVASGAVGGTGIALVEIYEVP